MANVFFLPAAEDDFQAALQWYGERSPRAAARFAAAVDEALQMIGDNPEQWPQRDRRHRFFRLRRYPYIVVYRIRAEEVFIVAIAHGRRSRASWKDRN